MCRVTGVLRADTPALSPFLPGRTHAIAGCAAGLAATLALQPLDVVKTRLQVQDGAPRGVPRYAGTWHALRTIGATEGVSALYAGLAPALLGAGVSWGAYFAFYTAAKGRWAAALGGEGDRLPPSAHLAAAAEAGAAVVLLTNPVWVVKTRMQLQARGGGAKAAAVARAVAPAAARAAAPPRAARVRGGVTAALRSIVKEEGVAGLYRGLVPSLLLVSHGAIQFAAYEELKRIARVATATPPDAPLPSPAVALAGAASKFVAATATYPTQVLRARLQQKQLAAGLGPRYDAPLAALRTTLAREGVAGLYKGLAPTLLRVVPQSAVSLVVYERVAAALAAWSEAR